MSNREINLTVILYQTLKGKSNGQIYDTQNSVWHSVRDPVLLGITQMVILDDHLFKSFRNSLRGKSKWQHTWADIMKMK